MRFALPGELQFAMGIFAVGNSQQSPKNRSPNNLLIILSKIWHAAWHGS